MAVHSLDCCLPETEGDTRPWQDTVWTVVCLRLRVILARPWQYTVWTVVCLRLRVILARPWQYTVWTAVCLRLRVILGHGSTQSGLLSA